MNEPLAASTLVTLTPLRAGLRAQDDNTVDVLLRVQAPDAPPGQVGERPPLAIALVIDRSGSMKGTPIAEAKRCAEYVVSRLRPSDAVSLVQFDDEVQLLWPAQALGEVPAEGLRQAIAGIEVDGCTNLFGGWREGAESLGRASQKGLARVLILSDGQANRGLNDPEAIAAHCATWAAQGITTSTYGLGRNFNEDLMVAMARAGQGNHYYGDTADDLMEPFVQELDLLGSLCLRDLRITASAADRIDVQMLNDLPAVEEGWRLPDLAWGAEAWALFRLTVPENILPTAGNLFPLLRISVQGRTADDEVMTLERAGLSLPVLPPQVFDRLTEDERVARRRLELAAAAALTRMRKAAAQEDWNQVDELLDQATREFAGNAWVASMLEAMRAIADSRSRERMMKESLYSSSRLTTRLVAKEEMDAILSQFEATHLPTYLRRKASQGKANKPR